MPAISAELQHAYIHLTKEKLYNLKNSLKNLKNNNSDALSADILYISVIEIEKLSNALRDKKITNFMKNISHIIFKLRQEKTKINTVFLELLENCHDFIYESISNTGYSTVKTDNHFDEIARLLLLKLKLQLLSNISLTIDKNFSIW